MSNDKSRLTVLGVDPNRKYNLITRCECGTIKSIRKDHIKNGDVRSCGCIKREMLIKRNKTHGLANTSEYKSWQCMVHRCTNKTDKRYHDYGGRGIGIDNKWLSFVNFISDMGMKPFKGAQIDRIDNSKGYFKGNCRWVSRKTNQRNTRSSIMLTYNGATKSLPEFAEIYGINPSTLYSRIKNSGYSTKDAIETPVKSNKVRENNKAKRSGK